MKDWVIIVNHQFPPFGVRRSKFMKISKSTLLESLKQMIKDIENDDSFEGSIRYSFMETDSKDEVEVEAAWRFGNKEHGQGFMNVI